MRNFLLLVAVDLPQFAKRAIYRWLFGWKIGRHVRLGLSYIDASAVVLGDDVRIGHFNIFRGIKRLEIGAGTYIANLNQFFGTGDCYQDFQASLYFGDHVNFMSRHFVDVVGNVTIGARSTIGGRDTQFWSHTLRLREGRQVLEPADIFVGEEVYVGARATLVCCSIPAGAIVGAGSVVAKSFAPDECRLLLAGNPADIIKRYPVKRDSVPLPDDGYVSADR